jgi:hypothetical protein
MGRQKTALAAALLWAAPAVAEEQIEIRTYRVHHALFGDIGTLSDEIAREGESTRVVARADVKVELLGVTLHHVCAEWSETWHAGMLTYFRATTTRNGSTDSISGQHENGSFIVHVRGQAFHLPADIHPVHPWSLQFIRAKTLMSPESGRTFPADITDKGRQSIRIGGVSRSVRHYVQRSDTSNHLYFDDQGTLLLAEYRDITGKVSFTLQSDDAPRLASVR